jgi:hypothetical protein
MTPHLATLLKSLPQSTLAQTSPHQLSLACSEGLVSLFLFKYRSDSTNHIRLFYFITIVANHVKHVGYIKKNINIQKHNKMMVDQLVFKSGNRESVNAKKTNSIFLSDFGIPGNL